MPISPKEAETFARTRNEVALKRVYEHIDRQLKDFGLSQVCQITTELLDIPLLIEVSDAYTRLGWRISYSKTYDTRDGDFITWTFMK